MTNDDQGRDSLLRPLDALEDAGAADHDADDEDGLADELPEHERDDDRTAGGGVMSMGGTSVDRGTGTLGGQAQNGDDDASDWHADDDEPDFGADLADRALGHDGDD